MCKVLNKRIHGIPQGAIYIGRPSIWGNPFVIGKDGQRDDVIAKYETWLLGNGQLVDQLAALAGKDLVCWCAPARCHGDVLVRLANQPPNSTMSALQKGRGLRPLFCACVEAAPGASSPHRRPHFVLPTEQRGDATRVGFAGHS